MNESLQEIGARSQAKRYTEMAARAAAATERDNELTELLEESERLRLLAEMQLDSATWPEGVGQILHSGSDEPGEDVYALVDLYAGNVYVRRGQRWQEVRDSAHASAHDWPIADDQGPFIKLKDTWALDRMVKAIQEGNARTEKLESHFRGADGYYDPENRGYGPEAAVDGAIRAHKLLTERYAAANDENSRLESILRVERSRHDVAALRVQELEAKLAERDGSAD